MKTKYILLGETCVRHFENQDWQDLEICIENFNGDIISWNKKDSLEELLEQLRGWNNFIILGKKDLKRIEKNTKIEIKWQ